MKVERSALLPYSVGQMYSIVTDIEAYPEFIPWCRSGNIEACSPIAEHVDQVDASLDIAYGRLALAFSTRNINRKNHSVEIQLKKGPFKHLKGLWQFIELNDDACKVSLMMEFEFSNPLTRSLFNPLFESLIVSQMQAFEARAAALHRTLEV